MGSVDMNMNPLLFRVELLFCFVRLGTLLKDVISGFLPSFLFLMAGVKDEDLSSKEGFRSSFACLSFTILIGVNSNSFANGSSSFGIFVLGILIIFCEALCSISFSTSPSSGREYLLDNMTLPAEPAAVLAERRILVTFSLTGALYFPLNCRFSDWDLLSGAASSRLQGSYRLLVEFFCLVPGLPGKD